MNKVKLTLALLMIINSGFALEEKDIYSTDEKDITERYIKHFSDIGFVSGKIVVNNGYLPLLYFLHDTDLAVLKKDELRILRNTIYAKHGYIFSSKDLTEHFSRFKWYKPQYSNVDSRLTDGDKSLIQRVQAFENASPNKNLNAKDLVGTWLGMYPVPSDYAYNIVIGNNNTIEFGYNNMNLGAVYASKGTYKIENGFLVALITEQIIAVGNYFHEGYASTFEGMERRTL